MKKFYKDPEAEILILEASVSTYIKSGELDGDNFDNGDGEDIGSLLGD